MLPKLGLEQRFYERWHSMALQADRLDPMGVRLTDVEREMVEELVAKLGFHSMSDVIRFAIRSTHERAAANV